MTSLRLPFFAAMLVAAAMLAGCATPYAPQDLDFSGLNRLGSMALGTLESVRVVHIERDIHGFDEALELRLQPDLGDKLVIRLDDGRAVTLVLNGMQRFEAGQRVRVVSHTYSPYGPQVEHE